MKTVLVVEDEPAIREVVAEVLREEGYRVVVAADGRAGLELLAWERPDLVLMDVMMPELDGREALREARARPDLPPVPVVLMSAAVALGRDDPPVDAFLPKPFDLDNLLTLVNSLLGGPSAGASRS